MAPGKVRTQDCADAAGESRTIVLRCCSAVSAKTAANADRTVETETSPQVPRGKLEAQAVIAHIVLFSLKAGVSEDDRRGLADALSAAVRDIPSIRRAQIGPRVTHGRPYEQLMAVHYPYAVILEFDDRTGLNGYLDHPTHEDLARRFFACFEQALMYDFELHDSAAGLAALLGAG
jgi:hypothetical protein